MICKKIIVLCGLLSSVLHAMETIPTNGNDLQWESALKEAIDNKDFNGLVKLTDNKELCKTFPNALNRAFVHASTQNTQGMNIKMMGLFLTLEQININYNDDTLSDISALLITALRGHAQSVEFLLKQPTIDVFNKSSGKTTLEWMEHLTADSDLTNDTDAGEIIKLLKKKQLEATANRKYRNPEHDRQLIEQLTKQLQEKYTLK